MSLVSVFVVAVAGSLVGTVVGLLVYQMCQAGAVRDVRRDAYEAGYAEAARRWRATLERLAQKQ